MICCALLALLVSPLAWMLRPRAGGGALDWRPYGEAQSERAGFSPRARLQSFSFAFEGISFMLRTQHNAWIHAGATAAVIASGAALRLSLDDWRWLVAAMTFVWVAETLNTAFEHVCNVVSPQYSPQVKAAIGASVFTPYLMR